MIEYYRGYLGELKVRTVERVRLGQGIVERTWCDCRVVTYYIDDVPYDREILCDTCADYERRDTE